MKIQKVYCDNHKTKFMKKMKQISKGHFKDKGNNAIHFSKYSCLVPNCGNIVTIYVTHKGKIREGLDER